MADKKLKVAMLPWLSKGHLMSYLELAQLIAAKGHQVIFISTERVIEGLSKLPSHLDPLVEFVSLPLPWPENAEEVSPELLQNAYDDMQEPLRGFLASFQEEIDWIFCGFGSWVTDISYNLGIKCAFFSTFTAPLMGFKAPNMPLMGGYKVRGDAKQQWDWTPFPSELPSYESMKYAESWKFRTIQEYDMVVIRGCPVYEPEWFRALDQGYRKPVFAVGHLPSTMSFEGSDETWLKIKVWLDKHSSGTVVYVALGSVKHSQEEITEVALGLEKSKFPFLWALRGCNDTDLPEGFKERTRGLGMVCTEWVPQMKILGHVAVGGFLSHGG